MEGLKNIITFKPQRAIYHSTDILNVDVVSNTQFVSLDKSYIKFKLAPLSPTGNSTLSKLGGSACISTIKENIGGVSLPEYQYDFNCYTDFNTSSHEYKKFMNVSNKFTINEVYDTDFTKLTITQDGETAHTQTYSNPAYTFTDTTPISIILPLKGQLKGDIPLMFITGGIRYTFALNSLANVFTNPALENNTVADYSITDFSINVCAWNPTQQEKTDILTVINSGGDVQLQSTIQERYAIDFTPSTAQTISVYSGFRNNVNSVILDIRDFTFGTDDQWDAKSLIKQINTLRFVVNNTQLVDTEYTDITRIWNDFSRENTNVSDLMGDTTFSKYSFGNVSLVSDGKIDMVFNLGTAFSTPPRVANTYVFYKARILIGKSRITFDR